MMRPFRKGLKTQEVANMLSVLGTSRLLWETIATNQYTGFKGGIYPASCR